MKRWVVGFLFDENMEKVVLLQKNRPTWQRGLLNGVGGHIKESERAVVSMIREFIEEAGISYRRWKPLAVFEGLDGGGRACECFFFYGTGDAFEFGNVRTTTDEKVVKVSVDNLPKNLVKNLYWLIPMCFDPGLLRPVTFQGVYPK